MECGSPRRSPATAVLAVVLDARVGLAYRLTAMRARLRNPLFVAALVVLATLPAPVRAEGAKPAAVKFVGRAACEPCHAPQAKAWQGSRHDLAMQEARDGTVLGNFEDAEFHAAGVGGPSYASGERPGITSSRTRTRASNRSSC